MPKLEISKVHDAYAKGGECPLCTLVLGAEEAYLHSFQHGRVMEPSVRVKTNATGFCPEHYRRLYDGENKLGLGLVVHTHLQASLPGLRTALQDMLAGAGAGRKGGERITAAVSTLAALHESCYICDLLTTDSDRYAFTILYLWGKDPEFLPTFRASSGFCIGHFLAVLSLGRTMLRRERLELWLRDAVPLMIGSLERLERDLLAFTQLHHDANRGLGTEEERFALAGVLQKLAGGRFRQD